MATQSKAVFRTNILHVFGLDPIRKDPYAVGLRERHLNHLSILKFDSSKGRPGIVSHRQRTKMLVLPTDNGYNLLVNPSWNFILYPCVS